MSCSSGKPKKLTDIVEVYDARENTWKLFEIGLSAPRRLMAMISSQKDRVVIMGGIEKDGTKTKVVEEIDFLKRNCFPLASLKYERSGSNAFLVNDAIYAFAGDKPCEKYCFSVNRWQEISAAPQQIFGSATLLYE